MSDHQDFLKNMRAKSGRPIYLSAQGPSDAADGSTDQGSSYDPRIRPTSGDDLNSHIVNEWSSITRPGMDSHPNVPVNTVVENRNESEEESDIDDIAPNLAFRVTAMNLAAVLRMNSDLMYLYELVQTYDSFDDICRNSEYTKDPIYSGHPQG